MRILCLDVGSSSVKFAAYATAERCEPVEIVCDEIPIPATSFDAADVLENILRKLGSEEAPSAVGHRIVFGGPKFIEPVIAEASVVREIEQLINLEPLHLQTELQLVSAVAAKFPELPQVLCFDTAFHHAMPSIAKRLPLPSIAGIAMQRYGFHGLSYEYVVSQLHGAPGRTIIAHLGSGASLCAVRDGAPVDTTMGLSPLGGLMMATRPGDLDPGVILALLRTNRLSVSDLTDLLYYRAGLLGVSGYSADMRDLIAFAAIDTKAAEAVALFEYQLLKQIGALIATLGGLDQLIFTGGIGEHQPQIRGNACNGLAFLGVRIDEAANARGDSSISSADSTVSVRVMHTDETLMVARHTLALIAEPSAAVGTR